MAEDVGAIFAKLGITTDEFEAGMKRASGIATSQSGQMSAAMKRNNREAAESARLVSESLDLHISRPLARVMAQLPGLGTALSALGGIGGAAGLFALGTFVVERLEPAFNELLKTYGLVGETIDEVGKRVKESDDKLIAGLERKIHLQEAYNRLVLGLSGGSLEAANLKLLQQENEELKEQLELKVRALAMNIANPSAGMGLHNLWSGIVSSVTLKPIPIDEGALKTAQEALASLKAKIQQVEDVIDTTGWQEYRDQVDAAAAATAKMTAEHEKWANAMLHKVNLELAGAQAKEYADSLAAVQKQVAALAGSAMPAMPFTTAMPAQATGGLAGFKEDQAAQMKLAAEATADAGETVASYKLKLQELAALQDGPYKVSADAYAAAVDKISRAMDEAGKKADKYLTSMSAGAAEFFRTFDAQAGDRGKFVMDELNRGVQGVEESIARLAVTGRSNFSQLLQSMSEELIKFAESQALKEVLSLLNNSSFFGGLGGGGLFGSGGIFGGGKAGGGDVMPGMTYLVGEQGPEVLTMGRNAGSITPNGGGSGGDTHNHYYDLRGADAAAVERLQRMLPEVENRAAYRGYMMSLEASKRATK